MEITSLHVTAQHLTSQHMTTRHRTSPHLTTLHMTTRHSSIFERRPETQKLTERLISAKEGELVPYTEIESILGMDHRAGNYMLKTARSNAEAANKTYYITVNKQGVKRLPPGDVPSQISEDRRVVRRRAKKALNRTKNLDWHRLTQEQQNAVNAERSLLYFVEQSTTDKQSKKLTEATGGGVLTAKETTLNCLGGDHTTPLHITSPHITSHHYTTRHLTSPHNTLRQTKRTPRPGA